MFWLAVQGLHAPIAILSFIIILLILYYKIIKRGDDKAKIEIEMFMRVVLNIVLDSVANLAGGVLLAKTLQINYKY